MQPQPAYIPPPTQTTYVPPPPHTNASFVPYGQLPTMPALAAQDMPQTTPPIPTYVPANSPLHTQTQQWLMLGGQGREWGRRKDDSPDNVQHLEPNPLIFTMHPEHQPMQCKQVDVATPPPIHTNNSTSGTYVIVVGMMFHIGTQEKLAPMNAGSPIIGRIVITWMQQPSKQQANG